MKLAVMLFFSSLALAQQPATTSGSCSPIASDNTGTITINCPGMSTEQGQKILAVVNKILANQIDPNVVMAKLDEILHAVNPNLPKKTYTCRGGSKTEEPNPSGGITFNINSGPDPSGKEMAKLNDARQYKELLKVCTAQIESNPAWLTPRLFCALAYGAMGDTAKAKEMLAIYDAGKGPAYDGDPTCKEISDFLHANLK